MKVLFVYPRYPHDFRSLRHSLKFIDLKAALTPLELPIVAAMLDDSGP